jgi:glycosyltransferase involved in cell wall biosynthesis
MVTFDVGGNRELIADGTSGFLAPCQDLAKLLRCAAGLFQGELRERMRSTARRHVAQHFSAEVVAQQYLALFERYVAARRTEK